MVLGRSTVVLGRSTMVFGRSTMVLGRCTIVLGRSTMVLGRSTTVFTAVHQGLPKYLTAQDTHISPTSSNHSRTLPSHGNLLSLQSQSTIQEYKTFLFLILSELIRKLVIALS